MEVKVKETLDHHLEIYFDLECIATHPIISGINKSLTDINHIKNIKRARCDTKRFGDPSHSAL